MMSLKNRQIGIATIIIALLLASLACSMPLLNAVPSANNESASQLPLGPIPTPGLTINGNNFTLVLTEDQMNAYVISALQSQSGLPLTSPLIKIGDEQIQLTANITQNQISIPATIIFQPIITEQGQIEIQIVSADLGPLPIPQAILDEVAKQVNGALVEALGLGASHVFIETLSINPGSLTVQGRYQ